MDTPEKIQELDGIITAKKIYLMDDKEEVLTDGCIEIREGKIARIIKPSELTLSSENVIARAEIITPGLIDAHTHLGIIYESFVYEQKDGNEISNPITPELQALDAIWPQDTCFEKARAAGVTCVSVNPGSANVIGGVCSIIKTAGNNVEDMVVRHPAGIKCALGINPKSVYKNQKKTPMTRMAIASLLRKALIGAKEYREKRERENNEKPDYDLGKENLVKVLSKEIPLRIHCARADDIYTALRIANEFNINIVLDHAYEAHMAGLPKVLAEKKIPVILGPSFRVRGSSESQNFSFKTAKILLDHGLISAQMTDHPVIPIWYLTIQAALAQKEGLPYIEALKSITSNASKILEIHDRVGSIEVGKDADLVLYNGDPLDPRTHVLKTVINGKIVYERNKED